VRLIIYAFILATVFLIFKAFFLDAYLEEKRIFDGNVTVEKEAVSAPKGEGSTEVVEKKKERPEVKKMPLDQLGDDITKHIKL
jgi:hypothetical protein